MGFINNITDDPIDTYAKTVFMEAYNIEVSQEDMQGFLFDTDVVVTEHTLGTENGDYWCTTTTNGNQTLHTAAYIHNGEFGHIPKGVTFYAGLCEPDTEEGRTEKTFMQIMSSFGSMFK